MGQKSHPLRVRGLKPALLNDDKEYTLVAPFTGAWIETRMKLTKALREEMSHPLRVRGLKPKSLTSVVPMQNVAPFTGAWIETGDE